MGGYQLKKTPCTLWASGRSESDQVKVNKMTKWKWSKWKWTKWKWTKWKWKWTSESENLVSLWTKWKSAIPLNRDLATKIIIGPKKRKKIIIVLEKRRKKIIIMPDWVIDWVIKPQYSSEWPSFESLLGPSGQWQSHLWIVFKCMSDNNISDFFGVFLILRS